MKTNYTKFQKAAYVLWKAGFEPHLVYNNGDWVKFRVYAKRANGPIGGPLWPYICVDETEIFPGKEVRHPIGLAWD